MSDRRPRTPATREQIRERLRALAESAPPAELAHGAMCYRRAGPPARVEHVCVTCGERTVYALPGRRKLTDELWRVQSLVSEELPAMRRTIARIRGLDVRLDESRLCQRCSPGATPAVGLEVRYPDDQRVHRVQPITLDDVKLLAELASQATKHEGAAGRETALQEHLARLEELLGVDR